MSIRLLTVKDNSHTDLRTSQAQFLGKGNQYREEARGGTHDIFGRGCATIKSLYRPFLEFLTKKLDPFRNFCA